MSNIVEFPKKSQKAIPETTKPESPLTPVRPAIWRVLLSGLVRWVWIVVVLLWPILKWVISIEVFFRAICMAIYWNTPGRYAGWEFLLHFAVLSALTYFVACYKPKGL